MSPYETSERAKRKLAAMILVELDVEIDPAMLSRFIRSKWHLIAPLVHIIHDEPDTTKHPAGATGGASVA